MKKKLSEWDIELLTVSIVIVGLVIGLLLCGLLLGCEPDGCEHLETRCDGQVAQICGDDQNWQDSMDCSTIEPADMGWKCCYAPDVDEFTCDLPEFCGTEVNDAS